MFFHMLLLLTVISIQVWQNAISAQQVAPGRRSVVPSLALGGMIQGLLDMQIRPEGGFYEDKYKAIFTEDYPKGPLPPVPVNLVDRHQTSKAKTDFKEIVSQDGRLLLSSIKGRSPNPCFETERIEQNSLLSLICSLRLRNVSSHKH